MPGRGGLSNGHLLCGDKDAHAIDPFATVPAQPSGSASQGVALSAFGGHLRIGSVVVPILTVSPLISSPRRRDFHEARIRAHLTEKTIPLFSFSVFSGWFRKSPLKKAILPCFSKIFNENQFMRWFSVPQPVDRAIGSLAGGSCAFPRGRGCKETRPVPAFKTGRFPAKPREAGGSS